MTEFYTSVVQYGSKILYRGYKNGRRVHDKLNFAPTLYTSTEKQTTFKTLYGQSVDQIKMASIPEAKDFIKKYEDIDGFTVFGMTQFNYQYIADKFPNEINFNIKDMKISFFDIETTTENGFSDPKKADEQILLISVHEKFSQRNIVFGYKPYDKKTSDIFEYRMFKDEPTMLKGFLEYWQGNTPDIISGWNIEGYDIPYVINRITKILGDNWAKKLSPWSIINSRDIHTKFGQQTLWDIVGVVVLDYLDLYKKYTYSSRESYALGFIAQFELGDTKLELEGSFKDQYTNQWDDFVRYNAKDSSLVDRLDSKLCFIELACTVAYIAKCNIKDTFGPVKTWDIFIYNYLKAKNIVIPKRKDNIKTDFEGAWVKEPIPGLYGWTISFDFSALYPSVIRQWNMSPETLIGIMPGVNVDIFLNGTFTNPDEDCTIAANGAMFAKDHMGIVPEVIKVIIDGRKISKKEMLTLEQELQLIDAELKSRVPV